MIFISPVFKVKIRKNVGFSIINCDLYLIFDKMIKIIRNFLLQKIEKFYLLRNIKIYKNLKGLFI